MSTKPAAIRLTRIGRDLERQGRCQRGRPGGERPANREADGGAPAAGAAHEQQRAAGPHLLGRDPCELERQPEVLLDGAPRFREVHLGQRLVMRTAGRDEHVVDRLRLILEEPLERVHIGCVEGGRALRIDLARRPAPSVRDCGRRG